MKKFLSICVWCVAGLLSISAFVMVFLGYFVSKTQNNIVTDGLGRTLEKMPIWANFLPLSANSHLWPGLGWAVFDFVTFWTLLGISYLLIELASKKLSTGTTIH